MFRKFLFLTILIGVLFSTSANAKYVYEVNWSGSNCNGTYTIVKKRGKCGVCNGYTRYDCNEGVYKIYYKGSNCEGDIHNIRVFSQCVNKVQTLEVLDDEMNEVNGVNGVNKKLPPWALMLIIFAGVIVGICILWVWVQGCIMDMAR